MRPSRSRRQARGSSLLLVLWAIMLMAFAIIGLVRHLDRGLDESIAADKQFRARLLLQSARTLAGHPVIGRGDPLLTQQVSPTASYAVRQTTEGTALAINALGASGLQRRFAARLFESWGLDASASRTLTDSIADWIDADSNLRTMGAEREFYLTVDRPDFPHNRPFSSLDELLLVRGFAEVERRQPEWRRWLTLFGDGSIDVSLASPQFLAVLFDVTTSEVSRFTSARLGPDALRDTKDDPVFSNLKEVRSLLDVPEQNYTAVAPILTLNHPVKRTECLATVGRLERRLTIISGEGVFLVHEE